MNGEKDMRTFAVDPKVKEYLHHLKDMNYLQSIKFIFDGVDSKDLNFTQYSWIMSVFVHDQCEKYDGE